MGKSSRETAVKPKVLTLMFHRVDAPQLGCAPEQFARYLQYLIQHFPIVLPGEKLNAPLSIFLTFDDAYYDFYHYVYPLLRQHNIKALLAVPTQYITASTQLEPKQRLQLPSYEFMEASYQDKAPLCTWQELKEMHDSGHVLMANHSHSHANLANDDIDFEKEILTSKQILEQQLNTTINYFVYPYGKMTRALHKMVCQNYQFALRIGGAINYHWDYQNQHIYRVTADHLWTQGKPITSALIYQLSFKYWLNRLRKK